MRHLRAAQGPRVQVHRPDRGVVQELPPGHLQRLQREGGYRQAVGRHQLQGGPGDIGGEQEEDCEGSGR